MSKRQYRTKTANYLRTLVVFYSSAIMLYGCNENLSEGLSAQVTQSQEIVCDIALTPHPGTSLSDQGIRQYQNAVQETQNIMPHLERLGWAYIRKAQLSFDPGYYKLAEQTALCMASKQPGDASAQLLLGHSLHNMHRFAEAEELAHSLVQTRGRWFDFGLLGDTLMEQGKLEQAAEVYQNMMDQNPGPEAYNRAAQLRWLTGDLDGALEIIQLSINSYKGRLSASTLWSYVKLARLLVQAGQTAHSLEILQFVLSGQPDYAPALLLKGKLLLSNQQNHQALAVISKAAQLNPLPVYRWALIEALQSNHKFQEIQQIEQQLIATSGTEDRRGFALYLAATGQQTGLAVTLANQELQLRQDIFTLDVLAWALWADGQTQLAKHYSDKALAEGTRSARLYYHAGVISAASGQVHEAKLWLDYAVEAQADLWPSERQHLNRVIAAL